METDFWVGISTEMHGFILLDEQDNILCDYVSWQDERVLWEIVEDEMFDKKGMPLKSGIASTNLFVLLDNKPEIRQKKMRFFTLGNQ